MLKMLQAGAMNTAFFRIILFFFLISVVSCGGNETSEKIPVKTEKENGQTVEKIPVKVEPVTFRNISGVWQLRYSNNYGYEFRLYKNYRAVVIIFLSESSLVFRGVYTIEDGSALRVNLSEMKRVDGIKNINVSSNFVKTKSSYFIFSASGNKAEKKLLLRPKKIYIDGNDSEGYFEPVLALKKIR